MSNLWELYAVWFIAGFGVNSENGITYPIIAENWTKGRGLMGGAVQGLYFIGLMIDAIVTSLVAQWRLALTIIGVINYGELFSKDYLLVTIFGTILVASAFLLTIPLVSLAPTYIQVMRVEQLGAWLIILPIIGAAAYGLAGYLSGKFGRAPTLIALSIITIIASILLIVTSTLISLRYIIPYSMVLAYLHAAF